MRPIALFVLLLAGNACSLPLNGTGPDDPSLSTPPLPSDKSASCHSLTMPYPAVPSGACAGGINEDGNVQGTMYLAVDSTNACQVLAVPEACSACNYTCDCMLRALGACSCTQTSPGGLLQIACQ
jgi:hypothetical protein